MNLSTQATKDILFKIERDPGEVRHWRQLLILCFDQKAVETLKTLQVIINGLEQFWNEERRLARVKYENEKQQARSRGTATQALGSPTVLYLPLTPENRALFIEVSRNPQSITLLFRLGRTYADDFKLPKVAKAHYERALALNAMQLEREDLALRDQIKSALHLLESGIEPETKVEIDPKKKKLTEDLFSPEQLGVKSPVHQRPSAASLMKRTGKLSVDQGRLQEIAVTEGWSDTQKRLEDLLLKIQERVASLCSTPIRPLRLPRSIAPSQWLDFLEGHISLQVSSLNVHAYEIPFLPEIKPETREILADHAKAILIWLQMLDSATLQLKIPRSSQSLASAGRITAPAPTSAPVAAEKPQIISQLFSLIDAGSLEETETQIASLEQGTVPADQLSTVWSYLGLAYQNQQDTKKAVTAYRASLELNPDNMQSWFNQGMILHEEGAHQQALECYERASELAPQQPKIWCNLGALQFQLGDFTGSVESLRKATNLKLDYARAWDNLAASLCALDELIEAERCCLRALQIRQDYADPQFKLGSIYFQQNRLEEAEKAFRAALRSQPTYPLAGHYLAMILARTKRLPEALEVIKTSVAPVGESLLPSMAWTELGYHLYERADFTAAIEAYHKALSYTPEKGVIWLDAGVAHHQLGNLSEALNHYEQATRYEPELPRAWHNLGVIRQSLNDEPGAQEAYSEAERLMAAGR